MITSSLKTYTGEDVEASKDKAIQDAVLMLGKSSSFILVTTEDDGAKIMASGPREELMSLHHLLLVSFQQYQEALQAAADSPEVAQH